MTRLGPLTSQALGRSPYDIVVQGEGEDNPRAPRQQYDERGRPVNAETRRINRDIVRSHNEVMQVIGVAEPENGVLSADDETNRRLLQQHYEDHMGRTFWAPLRTAGMIGVWALKPLYQRVLLFRRFDDSLPYQTYQQNYTMQAMFSNVLVGLPCAIIERQLTQTWYNAGYYVQRERWKQIPYHFLRAHLRAYMWLQRMSIAPQYPWLPPVLFFVPFSSQSPIRRPPPLPESLSWPSLIGWAGQTFLCLAPMALMAAYIEAYERIFHRLNHYIFDSLDPPSNPELRRPVWYYSPFTGERQLAGVPPAVAPNQAPERRPQIRHERDQAQVQAQAQASEREREHGREREREQEQRPPVPPPPSENERLFSDPEDSRRNAMEAHAAEIELEAVATMAAQPGQHESAHEHDHEHEHDFDNDDDDDDDEHTHHPHYRSGTPAPGSPVLAHRRNTVSSGGDDGYISEEEEFELSTTLISFDVEAAEAGDQLPNAWSAELRQSSGGEDSDLNGHPLSPGRRARGTYIRGVYYPDANVAFKSDTMLSRLPATVYSSCTAVLLTTLTLIDLEALTLRTLAWTYRMRHGEPVNDLHGLFWFPYMTMGMSIDGFCHFLMPLLFQGFVDAACISMALGLGYVYHGSRHDWSFFRVVKEKFGWNKKKGKGKARA